MLKSLGSDQSVVSSLCSNKHKKNTAYEEDKLGGITDMWLVALAWMPGWAKTHNGNMGQKSSFRGSLANDVDVPT